MTAALNYPSTFAFNPARWYAEEGSGVPNGVLSGLDTINSPMRPTLTSARGATASVVPLLVLAIIVLALQKRYVRLRASGSLK